MLKMNVTCQPLFGYSLVPSFEFILFTLSLKFLIKLFVSKKENPQYVRIVFCGRCGYCLVSTVVCYPRAFYLFWSMLGLMSFPAASCSGTVFEPPRNSLWFARSHRPAQLSLQKPPSAIQSSAPIILRSSDGDREKVIPNSRGLGPICL